MGFFGGFAGSRLLRWLLPSLVCLICIRLWVIPMQSSFWVDEMGTAFVVQRGAQDPSLQAAPQVSESIYYALAGVSVKLFGSSEAAYRLPALLAMVLALFFIYRLAAKLIHPAAAWFAVFTCLSLRGFNYQAADARPYALGTCVAAASLLLLIRWLDSGRYLDGLFFAVAATLLWRVHLIYWPFYLIFFLYTLVRLWRSDTKTSWLQAAVVFVLLGISLLPVLATALALNRQAGAHVIVPKPSLNELTTDIKVGLVVGAAALAALAARWLRWPEPASTVSSRGALLILSWWLCQPVALLAYSWITGHSVFLGRYLSIALPGAALSATMVAALFVPADRWRPLSLALGAGVLLFMGQWNKLLPTHDNSGWRAAVEKIQALDLDAATPVICPSPFIEAQPPVWSPSYRLPGFLYAHLFAYPIPGKIYPFPFESSPETERYVAGLTKDVLAKSQRFVVYGGDANVRFWRNWFATRVELTGWNRRTLGPFGDVDAVEFTPPSQH